MTMCQSDTWQLAATASHLDAEAFPGLAHICIEMAESIADPITKPMTRPKRIPCRAPTYWHCVGTKLSPGFLESASSKAQGLARQRSTNVVVPKIMPTNRVPRALELHLRHERGPSDHFGATLRTHVDYRWM